MLSNIGVYHSNCISNKILPHHWWEPHKLRGNFFFRYCHAKWANMARLTRKCNAIDADVADEKHAQRNRWHCQRWLNTARGCQSSCGRTLCRHEDWIHLCCQFQTIFVSMGFLYTRRMSFLVVVSFAPLESKNLSIQYCSLFTTSTVSSLWMRNHYHLHSSFFGSRIFMWVRNQTDYVL